MTPPPTPVCLDLLGRIDLRGASEEFGSVLAQPKRLGLLVFLTLRRQGGFVRRDELLGALWPDSPPDRGRAALRQALRFLRRELGSDVIVNRGDAEVGLGPGQLQCDALELQRAHERGEDRRVVDLYAGELLPGFHLDGAYEFERWLHGERRRLRVIAIGSALRVAESAEDRGDLAAAADQTRWALQWSPTDEAIARRLISLLGRNGNRAGAVAVYDALAETLFRELELEPSPETSELVESLQGSSKDITGGSSGPGTSRPGASARRVLVLDFDNLTDDADLDPLSRLTADTLAQGLALIPELQVVPPMAAAGASAESMEAGTVVSGSFHLTGERLRFQVRIVNTAEQALMAGPQPIDVDRSDPVGGMEELRGAVMLTLGPALTDRSVHVRGATRPPGLEAFRIYLDGLERFVRRDWAGALAHFRRCVDLEPGYALPRVVGAIALWNLGELERAEAAAIEAETRRPSLGRFEQAVLDMVRGWLDGDWAAAHRASRLQADIAPGSIPHFQVAEEARRLNRPRQAREILNRLDPEAGELRGWIFYWIERTTAEHLIGDHRQELELASRCRELHPTDPAATLLEMRALAALGRTAEVERLAEQALASPGTQHPQPPELMVKAALEIREHEPDSDDAAIRLLRRAVAWLREHGAEDGTPAQRRELARALYHLGELDEARAIFTELAGASRGRVQPIGYHHGHLQAHLDEGYLLVIAVRTGAADEAGRLRQFLERLEWPFLYGGQWFWLAAAAALEGEVEEAARLLGRAFADGLPMEPFIHTDAHLALARGQPRFDALMRPKG